MPSILTRRDQCQRSCDLRAVSEALVEQPRAGVSEVGLGDEMLANGGDEIAQPGAVECADRDRRRIRRASSCLRAFPRSILLITWISGSRESAGQA